MEALPGVAFSFFYLIKILQAIELYSKAIELNPTNAVYYANRSISHLRLENYGYALADASRAIETDKTYLKAYYRCVVAQVLRPKKIPSSVAGELLPT